MGPRLVKHLCTHYFSAFWDQVSLFLAWLHIPYYPIVRFLSVNVEHFQGQALNGKVLEEPGQQICKTDLQCKYTP